MDYVEAFKNLRANNKYGRKSPHKAILMLSVIEMFEKGIQKDNEIYYDEKLKSMFLKVWNMVLPEEPLFHPDAYFPFWHLQNDSFWHIVPVRGKEDILSLMRDTNIKPSEAKLIDSVKYAELDDDLYFLMTIASSRSSLKRALLETYTSLSDEQIDKLSGSTDNYIDHSLSALNEYEQILSSSKNDEVVLDKGSSNEMIQQFRKLNDDLQIALNYEYYSFLKSHRNERNMMREVCPDVFALYDCLVNKPLCQTDISPSFAFIYDNFLCDLKIALMSENESMDLIDKIEAAIEILRGNIMADNTPKKEEQIDVKDDIEEKEVDLAESKLKDDSDLDIEYVYLDSGYNVVKTVTTSSHKDALEKEEPQESRKGKAWTKEEEDRMIKLFLDGIEYKEIAELLGRSEVAIKMRLAKLGWIVYNYENSDAKEPVSKDIEESSKSKSDFSIENGFKRCSILNKRGNRVFTADGKLKYINGKLYRLKLKDECFTVKIMQYDGDVWLRGDKKIVAYPQAELYRVLSVAPDYCEAVEDIVDSSLYYECKLKVDGVWYNYKGNVIADSSSQYQKEDRMSEKKHAILRALSFFRLPASIREISRTISKSVWGGPVREEDVERVMRNMQEVENIGGRYIRKKK